MQFVLWLFLVLFFVGSNGSGTTPNIEEIIIGRCHFYQHVKNPDPFKNDLRNCTQVWQAFRDAFLGKDDCGVESADYDRFISLTSHPLDAHQDVLLWSGSRMQQFVEQYSELGERYSAMASFMPGYLIDYLTFCSDDTDINYDRCPGYGSCAGEAMRNYWSRASVEFAVRAKNPVRILLNGSSGFAYNSYSILALDELPNLNPDKVSVTVIVIYEVDKPRLSV